MKKAKHIQNSKHDSASILHQQDCDTEQYSIQNLYKTFIAHAKRADEHKKQAITSFLKNYPNTKVPQHMLDDFNICKAFVSMCKELLNLSKQQAEK